MPAPPQIAGYVRVSRQAQADNDSLDNQEHALRQAGATLIFQDVVSGFSKKARRHAAGFNALLAAIRNGQVSKLLVKDLSRAARRDTIVTELLEACEQAGIEFLSLQSGTVSTSSSSEWLSVRMLMTFVEFHSRDLSDRIRRGQASYVARGIPAFSSVTLGWHLQRDPYDRHKAIPGPGWDDAREAVVRYISGEWSGSDVARFIYEKHGKLRTPSTALGWLKSHGVRGHFGRHRGEVVISNCYPPLINDAEALALDLRIAQRQWKHGGRQKHAYALSGILTCAHCKQKLVCSTTRNSAGSEYPYVRCNTPGCEADKHRIPHDKLEHWLVQVRLAAEAGRLFDTRAQRTNETAPPSTELLNARKRAARLRQVLAELDSPGVRSDLQEAEERLRKLEAPRAKRPAGGGWERFTAAADGWWAEASPTERNAELLSLIELAEVDLSAWKRLPPEPVVAGDPAGFTEHEEWEETSGRSLIPVLQLRA